MLYLQLLKHVVDKKGLTQRELLPMRPPNIRQACRAC